MTTDHTRLLKLRLGCDQARCGKRVQVARAALVCNYRMLSYDDDGWLNSAISAMNILLAYSTPVRCLQ